MTAISRFASLAGLLCVAGCGALVSEYQRGYDRGVAEVRQVRKEKGWEGEAALQFADAFSYFPVQKSQSADWNAGYQKGVQDEIRR